MHPDARVSRIERFRLRAGLGRWNPGQQSEAWIFLIPGLAGFVIFVLVPIVMSMGVSLTRWDLLGPPEFVGIANYVELLTRDRIFSRVLGNTLYYTVVIFPLQLGLGLTLATALNQQIRAMSLYRLIYFMPVVTNIVAAALVFQWLLNRDFGIISSIIWDIAERYGVPVQPPGNAECLALRPHRRRMCRQVAGRSHQHQHSLLLRIRVGGQQIMLVESRFDTLDRMEIAVFPQQQRTQLRPQRFRV